MRPAGEVRLALHQAAQTLTQSAPGATWRDMAALAGVGYLAARVTVENMARAGQLSRVDRVHVPGSRKPMVRYAPAAQPGHGRAWVSSPGGALAATLRVWHR